MSQVRAVVGARVSVYADDAQVSHTVQRESGERYAGHQGWEVIGYFEDLDVSASIAPWERPDLGPWLNERASEWDAMIFAKVDRAFRSVKDCADVAHWAEQNRKILVFTDDSIVLNFRDEDAGFASMMAKAFLMLASLFAEMELKRIRTRVKDAHAFIRTKDRWKGGLPPFGYTTVDHPEGGKTLDVDPVSAEYVRYMAAMVLEGKSLWEVAHSLNAKGVPTPVVYGKMKAGQTVEAKKWVQNQVGQILRNQACLGLKMMGRGAKARLVRGDDGLPVRISDPLFTDEEWIALQGALDKRTHLRERSANAAPLLGIVMCEGCGDRMYSTQTKRNGKTYQYYRCVQTADRPRCEGKSAPAEKLHAILSENVEDKLGRREQTIQVFVPGEDHTRELNQVKKALNDVRSEYDLGFYGYQGGEDEYKDRVKALVAQRRILEALPQRDDQWVAQPTGKTIYDAYMEAATDEERRQILLDNGVFIYWDPATSTPRVHDEYDTEEEVLRAVRGA